MENWLAILVGGFLLAMVLYGHYKGLIHMAVALVSLVLSLFVVKAVTPEVTVFLRDKTPVYELVQGQLEKGLGLGEEQQEQDDKLESAEEGPAMQRSLIEGLNLPSNLKEALLENNNNEVYKLLGVERFRDYITNYITIFIINIISYILTFLVVYVLVRFLFGCVNLIARLPILNGMNQLAGAVLGGIEGLLIVWVMFLVITACSGTTVGIDLINQIEGNSFLSFLYQNNLLQIFIMESVKQIL